MTIPLPLRIGLLVIATTGFYTYVGQLVPQKEVQPPQETLLRADLTTADMVTVGRQIMEGRSASPATRSASQAPCGFPIWMASRPARRRACRA